MKVVDIDPARIVSGPNVRIDETELGGLAESIRQFGIQQPITVTPDATGEGVECLFGHRRLAAARLVGLDAVPCIVRPRADPATRVLRQLAENTHRKDMTPLELAQSYDELHEAGLSQTRIAEAVGVTQTDVSKHLQLLRYPDIIRGAVHIRRITLGDALGIPVALARSVPERELIRVVDQGGRAVRRWVRDKAGAVPVPSRVGGERSTVPRGPGRPPRSEMAARTVWSTINVDSVIADAVHDAATAEGITVRAWAERALQAALDAAQV